MFEKTKVVGVCLMLMCGTSVAQTIDEITELNRQAAIAEAKGKIELAKKASGPPAPAAPSGPSGGPGAFPLPSGMPGAPAAAPAPAWKMIPAKKGPSSPPSLTAIYGVGGSLIAELSESGSEGKYREGDKTPGGWTVSRIDKRNVDVTRQGNGKRKSAKFEKVALAFGTKVEVPKDPVSIPREQTPGSYSVPPLPSSYPAGR